MTRVRAVGGPGILINKGIYHPMLWALVSERQRRETASRALSAVPNLN